MELLPKKKKNKKRQRDLIDADESAVMTQSLAPPVAAHAPGRPEPMTGNGMLEANPLILIIVSCPKLFKE